MILPESDLCIDCRDNTQKDNRIDCKISISGRRAILDCRKNNFEKGVNGYYSEKVSRSDLQNASSKIVSLFSNALFPQFLKSEIVYVVNMDDEIESAFSLMKTKKKHINSSDHEMEKRIYDFSYISKILLELNSHNDITIFRMDNPLISREIKCGTIWNNYQICELIKTLIRSDNYNFFVNFKNKNLIELIPEIGGA